MCTERMVRGRREQTKTMIGKEVGEEGNDPMGGGFYLSARNKPLRNANWTP